MSTLISMVGQQPAAVAATAKTLFKKAGLQKILLLPTEKTEKEYGQLKLYLKDILGVPEQMIEEEVITTNIAAPPTGYQLAWEAINDYLKRNDLSQPVYFDTSPGLNYQTALISHHLKNDNRFQALYADNRKLHNLDNSTSWKLENIGFTELLKLYGLREKSRNKPADFGGIVEEVCITGSGKELSLVCACERYGRFYGLYRIWGKNGLQGQAQKNEAHRIKQEARFLESILKTPKLVNNLHPELIIWVNNKWLKRRLEAYGVKVIFCEDDNIDKIREQWEGLIEEKPWGRKPDESLPEMKIKNSKVAQSENQQWTGQNLLVVLGADPGATMKAIFTHKPGKLIVLWDSGSPWIKVLARRMWEAKEDIPSVEITFLPWNLFDPEGEPKHPVLPVGINSADYIVNITPGTKLHSWYLARLDVKGIYSLDNEKRQAVSILPADNERYSYDLPPVLTAAAVHQGTLAHEIAPDPADDAIEIKKYVGVAGEELQEKRDFLQFMVNVVAKSIAASQSKAHIPFHSPWDRGTKIYVDEKNYIECKDVNEELGTLKFKVCLNGKEPVGGVVHAPPKGGFWLEELVAGAFYAAGGKNIKDIRVGVKWPWLHPTAVPDEHRTDIDIVLVWLDHYICISCKARIKEKEWGETANEIIAEARAGFGRYAVPIIVRGGITYSAEKKEAQDSLLNDGLLQIGLGLLNKTSALKELVELAIKEYRTLSDNG